MYGSKIMSVFILVFSISAYAGQNKKAELNSQLETVSNQILEEEDAEKLDSLLEEKESLQRQIASLNVKKVKATPAMNAGLKRLPNSMGIFKPYPFKPDMGPTLGQY